MIRTFRCKDTEILFEDINVPRFANIKRIARRKLLYLHQAKKLDDLRSPPGNHLKPLKGDRKGQYSIRINNQWRLCFRWINNDAYDVEIIDYH